MIAFKQFLHLAIFSRFLIGDSLHFEPNQLNQNTYKEFHFTHPLKNPSQTKISPFTHKIYSETRFGEIPYSSLNLTLNNH